jgi:hypothetical protein
VVWLLALAVVFLSACNARPRDCRADIARLTDQIRALPGIRGATNEVANHQAQGIVYFTIKVDVADDITGDQLAAITSRYLEGLRTIDHSGYHAEFDAADGWNVFTIDSGELPITNDEQIASQARDWAALRHEFPRAIINLRATITHPGGALPIQEWGHTNAGTMRLPDAADYTEVTRTVMRLATGYPRLAEVNWTISTGSEHPADIKTSRRFPTGGELDVWNKLNADQTIPHTDKMTINGRVKSPVWLAEETRSHDGAIAIGLAQRHLPMLSALPAPVLYTASDQIQGHITGDGRATGPIAVTVGGCTDRDYLVYQPAAAEKALIRSYEKCH